MKPIEPASADKVGSVELNSAERRKLDEEFAFNWATQRTTIRWPIGGGRDVPFRNSLGIISHIGVNWGDAHQFSGPESVLTWGHLLSSRYQIPCSTAQLIPFRLIEPINQYLARLETVHTWLVFFFRHLYFSGSNWLCWTVMKSDTSAHTDWTSIFLPHLPNCLNSFFVGVELILGWQLVARLIDFGCRNYISAARSQLVRE